MSTRSVIRRPRLRAPSRAFFAIWAIVATVLLVLVTAHALVVMVAVPQFSTACSVKEPFQAQATLNPRWLGGERTWSDRGCSVTTGKVPVAISLDPGSRTVTASIQPYADADRATLQTLVPVLVAQGVPRRGGAHDDQPSSLGLDVLEALTPLADIPQDAIAPVVERVAATSVSADGLSATWRLAPSTELELATIVRVIWVVREDAEKITRAGAA